MAICSDLKQQQQKKTTSDNEARFFTINSLNITVRILTGSLEND